MANVVSRDTRKIARSVAISTLYEPACVWTQLRDQQAQVVFSCQRYSREVGMATFLE